MQPVTLLLALGLASGAHAVDILLHADRCGLDNAAFVCQGVNPDVCCDNRLGRHYWAAAALNAVPSNWNLALRVYDGGNNSGGCKRHFNTGWTQGRSYFCGQFRVSGAGYGFNGRKGRRDSAGESGWGKRDEEDGACTTSVTPDALRLGDGTMYGLNGMGEEQVRELEELVYAGDEIPASFDLYKQVQQ